ncbi:AI-2E family transporter [Coxiella burnetii]|uniref:AI-2E family transporter n=1 Tax=Coxiella burnetii TaxID=777 RepID=UPI000B957C4E|nr:AI-2E family transporter [Coxiella burnetii]OYK80291.1 AI-2E family transporter [Coxiella burnetii]
MGFCRCMIDPLLLFRLRKSLWKETLIFGERTNLDLRYLNSVAAFALVVLIVYLLFIGRFLFLPLTIALVLWYVIISLTALYQRIPFKKRLSHGFALFLAIVTTAIFLYLFFLMFTQSLPDLIEAGPAYQQKLYQLLRWFNVLVGGGRLYLGQLMRQIDLKNIFSELPIILSLTAANFTLVIVYLFFLLLEHRSFNQKLKLLCHSSKKYKKVIEIIKEITKDVNNYFKVKTLISLITALLSYFVLLGFKINNAEFWSTFVFLLNYIPYIGPLIAVVTLLIVASIQVTQLVPFIFLGILLTAIQIILGNFVEPKWLGVRLNLSPLVILLSLAFWGSIWGFIGLFLSVPIMVILTIILGKFPKTRPIAVMLSATGEVDS